jgi:hypothetical protein
MGRSMSRRISKVAWGNHGEHSRGFLWTCQIEMRVISVG